MPRKNRKPTGLEPASVQSDHHSLEVIANLLNELSQQGKNIMSDFSKLQSAVTENTTAVTNLIAALKAGNTDQATIDALTATVEQTNAAAVAAVTPPPAA
jgi:hypothetical protein